MQGGEEGGRKWWYAFLVCVIIENVCAAWARLYCFDEKRMSRGEGTSTSEVSLVSRRGGR